MWSVLEEIFLGWWHHGILFFLSFCSASDGELVQTLNFIIDRTI